LRSDTADRSEARIRYFQPDGSGGRFNHLGENALNLTGKVRNAGPGIEEIIRPTSNPSLASSVQTEHDSRDCPLTASPAINTIDLMRRDLRMLCETRGSVQSVFSIRVPRPAEPREPLLDLFKEPVERLLPALDEYTPPDIDDL